MNTAIKCTLRGTLIAATSLLLAHPMHSVASNTFAIFGDMAFNGGDGQSDTLEFGTLDFFGSIELTPDVRGFFELVLEKGDELIVDPERLWVSYAASDSLNIAIGRFHTPLGYWNRNFHHGVILQDTATRPFFLDFEDGEAGILPVHVVGLMLTGTTLLNSGEIGYELALANGPSINSEAGFNPAADSKPEIDINMTHDPNSDKSLAARIYFKLKNLPIQVGVFGMHNVVAESGTTTAGALTAQGADLMEQDIFGIDIYFQKDVFDALGEYHRFSHEDAVPGPTGVSAKHDATAWYIQLGYRVTPVIKTVYRHASLSFNADDVYFALLGTAEAEHDVLSLRYDFNDTNVFRLEYNHASFTSGADVDSYVLQWSFLLQ